MGWSLLSIGVPIVYRTMNPYALTSAERLDAFPKLGNSEGVNIWMQLQVTRGSKQSLPNVAWRNFLTSYVQGCDLKNIAPFKLDSGRRNDDEEVRNFLQIRRRRVRDYVDTTGLLTLPIFRTSHYYIRNEHSWWLRAQARIIMKVEGKEIGDDFRRRLHWIRTHTPEYRGSQSWHKWIQPGVLRAGWSTAITESWFWYEIRCPHMPGIVGNMRNIDDQAFTDHVDNLWLPLVRNIRWWSTSNPRTWTL